MIDKYQLVELLRLNNSYIYLFTDNSFELHKHRLKGSTWTHFEIYIISGRGKGGPIRAPHIDEVDMSEELIEDVYKELIKSL